MLNIFMFFGFAFNFHSDDGKTECEITLSRNPAAAYILQYKLVVIVLPNHEGVS